MKLKLEEIAFYLKSRIEVMYKNEKHKITRVLTSVNQKDCVGTMISDGMPLTEIKPVIKSISNITEKEMQTLFSKFGDMMLLGSIDQLSDIILIDCADNLDILPLRVCKELAKMNYDIFNWLPNDLAIELSCS